MYHNRPRQKRINGSFRNESLSADVFFASAQDCVYVLYRECKRIPQGQPHSPPSKYQFRNPVTIK